MSEYHVHLILYSVPRSHHPMEETEKQKYKAFVPVVYISGCLFPIPQGVERVNYSQDTTRIKQLVKTRKRKIIIPTCCNVGRFCVFEVVNEGFAVTIRRL